MSFGVAQSHRREDPRLLKGNGCFLDDIQHLGTLHVALLRSPHAHAEILAIDTEAARQMDGVVTVVTWADLGPAAVCIDPLLMHPGLTHPVTYGPLASDRVRFVGEPVAAVVAADRYRAEDARDAIQVSYQQLPPVSGLRRALADGAPVVYSDAPGNTAGRFRQQVGDTVEAMNRAPLRMEAEIWISRGTGQPMETRGVVAYPREDGGLTVSSSTQTPHRLQSVVAKLLGSPLQEIRVIAPDVGGGFGIKGCVYPEDLLVPVLAERLGQPVKWVEDRMEHMQSATQDREQCHRVELGLDRDGTILALRDNFNVDVGAYTPYGLVVCQNAMTHVNGPYRIPNLDISFQAVFTNAPAVGPYRGAGRPQGCFVIERTLDLAAKRFGLDPVALRQQNLIRPDELPYTSGLGLGPGKAVYDSGDYPGSYAMALKGLDRDHWLAEQAEGRQSGRLIGIGAVPYVEACGGSGFEGARISLLPNGRLHLATGATPQGQGTHTLLAELAGKAFGISPDQIEIQTGDTSGISTGVGTFGSRTTMIAGAASRAAALGLRQRCLEAAEQLLECSLHDLELIDGVIQIKGSPQRSLSLSSLYQAAQEGQLPTPDGGWTVEERYTPGQAAFANGAHACVVEILPATAEVQILRYVIVHDCGVVINPAGVDGQVVGGTVQGLGSTLYEQIQYDEQGQLLTGTFMDYLLPTATEVPHFELYHMESPNPNHPLGIKGAGEGGSVPVHAVIAQAVEDALAPLGIEVTEVPISNERLFTWLQKREDA